MRYHIGLSRDSFPHDLARTQVVFHGINKSGSLAMAEVMREAYQSEGRSSEFVSHYHNTKVETNAFHAQVDNLVNRHTFVVGHYLFGSLSPSPARIWLTLLRHPLPRIVSCYQWLKAKNDRAGKSKFPSLVGFVERSKGIAHSQVAQFGAGYGVNAASRRMRLSASDMYEIAIDELQANFYLLGIAEYFEESIFTFAGACGLKSVIPWARDNRNKGRRLVTELSAEESDAIQCHYQYDFRLYEYAITRFREQTRMLGECGDALEAYKDACKTEYKDRILLP
jgi:hypothetical protein